MHDLYDDVRDYPDDDSFAPDGVDSDEDGYEDLAWPADRRWRPAVALVGGVLAVGAVATAVILNSGDSATTKATIGAPIPHTAISTSSVPSEPSGPPPSMPPSASRTPQLPPETVTTLPPPTALPSTLPGFGPAQAPTALPPQAVPPPTLNPRTPMRAASR
jgi:hypothetical protein